MSPQSPFAIFIRIVEGVQRYALRLPLQGGADYLIETRNYVRGYEYLSKFGLPIDGFFPEKSFVPEYGLAG